MRIDTLPLPPQLKVRRTTLLNGLVAGPVLGIISIPNGLGKCVNRSQSGSWSVFAGYMVAHMSGHLPFFHIIEQISSSKFCGMVKY